MKEVNSSLVSDGIFHLLSLPLFPALVKQMVLDKDLQNVMCHLKVVSCIIIY